jgi:hypothetical protein
MKAEAMADNDLKLDEFGAGEGALPEDSGEDGRSAADQSSMYRWPFPPFLANRA